MTHRVNARVLLLGLAVASVPAVASAAQVTSTWSGGASSAWQDAGNWSAGVPNNAADTFVASFPATNTTAATIDVGGPVTVDQLTLAHGAVLTLGDSADDAFTLTGGSTGVGVSVPTYNTTTLGRTIAANVALAPASGSVIRFDTNTTNSPTGDAPISLTLAGVVSGNADLLKLGNGGLQLSGANTYTGVTTVQRNWIFVGGNAPSGAPGALGNATTAVELGNAGTVNADTGLVTNGAVTIGRDINVNVTGTGTAFLGAGSKQTTASSAYTGTITLNRSVQIVSFTAGDNLVDFQGKITGVGTVLKRAAGTAQLSNAANDYTGVTTLRGGYLLLRADAPNGAPGALGNATSAVTLGDTSTTSNYGLFTNGPVTVGRDITVSSAPGASVIGSIGGAATQTNASSTFGGAIALGRDTRLQSYTTGGNRVTFSGVISSTTAGRGIATSGPGVVRLSGANTYSGPTIVGIDNLGGTLELDIAAQVPIFTNPDGADVRSGSLKLNYAGQSNAAAVRTLLKASFDDAATPGVVDTGQIRSTTATTVRGLGYRDDGAGTIIKATLFGDADLDGGVSINDFNALAANFGQATSRVWADGDFDYDGGVSINDFNLLAGGFGQSFSTSSEAWAGLLAFAAANNDLEAFEAVTGVPEPAALGLLAAGATLAVRRRRQPFSSL